MKTPGCKSCSKAIGTHRMQLRFLLSIHRDIPQGENMPPENRNIPQHDILSKTCLQKNNIMQADSGIRRLFFRSDYV
ncbi:hypothetical protein AAGG74_08605 [Bacillus mexicanus]|uniref:hypothetical protein n=1 Tax=Bacillus mexicanus TaxID=2834415 RepID=UPI003D198873